jgi:hypothetical protein
MNVYGTFWRQRFDQLEDLLNSKTFERTDK